MSTVMKILSPIERSDFRTQKLEKRYQKFQKLTNEIRDREIRESVIARINKVIEKLNLASTGDKTFPVSLRKAQNNIVNILLREAKVVPKNYYRNLWLGLGMAVFGVPMGMAFGFALDNMAFLGIGIPIGMAIGIGIGTAMDEQAKKEGRQLEVDLG